MEFINSGLLAKGTNNFLSFNVDIHFASPPPEPGAQINRVLWHLCQGDKIKELGFRSMFPPYQGITCHF